MADRGELVSFNSYGWHKGFYNDDNYSDSLLRIRYSDYFEEPDDDEFPYDSAYVLLNGSCNHFAVSLRNVFYYNVHVIEAKDRKGFHAFCQVYKNRQWYYVDARGITSSFDEFLAGRVINSSCITFILRAKHAFRVSALFCFLCGGNSFGIFFWL